MASIPQDPSSRMYSKRKEWITSPQRLVFLGLCVILTYASFCLIYELVHSGFVTGTVIAFAALAASTYTAWWTHWLPPNVSVIPVGKKDTLSGHERLTLLYYNGGTASTFVKTKSIECEKEHLEIALKDNYDFTIEAKSCQPIHFYLRSTRGCSLTMEDFPVTIRISFVFWRGKREVHREEEFQLTVVQRRHSDD